MTSTRASAHIRSNIVGYLALFLALSGVSYAASLDPNSITSRSIKNGQVKGPDIRDGAVANADLADGAVSAAKVQADSLGGTQIDESSLAQVPSAAEALNAASATTAADASQLGGQVPGAFQQRVGGTCTGSEAIQSVGADGTVTCGSAGGGGTVTNVATGIGLTGGPITNTGTLNLATPYRLPQTCTATQVAKSSGVGGNWSCAADANTTYTAAASSGLVLTGTAFGLAPCTNGQVLKAGATAGTWACAADSPGTGAAGGDLAGSSYPNPTLAAGSVSGGPAGEIVDNSVTGADVSEKSLNGFSAASFSSYIPSAVIAIGSTDTQVQTLTDQSSGESGGLLDVPANARLVVHATANLTNNGNDAYASCHISIAKTGDPYTAINRASTADVPTGQAVLMPLTAARTVGPGIYNVKVSCVANPRNAGGTPGVYFGSGDITAIAVSTIST